MMDVAKLTSEVCAWVRDRCESEGLDGIEITPETDLLGSGAIDSLGFIDLIAFIEDSTGVTLDLMEIDPDAFSQIRGLCEFAVGSRPAE